MPAHQLQRLFERRQQPFGFGGVMPAGREFFEKHGLPRAAPLALGHMAIGHCQTSLVATIHGVHARRAPPLLGKRRDVSHFSTS